METIALAAKTYLIDKKQTKIKLASQTVNEKTDEFIKHVRPNSCKWVQLAKKEGYWSIFPISILLYFSFWRSQKIVA